MISQDPPTQPDDALNHGFIQCSDSSSLGEMANSGDWLSAELTLVQASPSQSSANKRQRPRVQKEQMEQGEDKYEIRKGRRRRSSSPDIGELLTAIMDKESQ